MPPENNFWMWTDSTLVKIWILTSVLRTPGSEIRKTWFWCKFNGSLVSFFFLFCTPLSVCTLVYGWDLPRHPTIHTAGSRAEATAERTEGSTVWLCFTWVKENVHSHNSTESTNMWNIHLFQNLVNKQDTHLKKCDVLDCSSLS